MNKLVLIGNGFDLAHGLKTKYSDFLSWYLNKALQRLNGNTVFEDKLMKLLQETNNVHPPFNTHSDFLELASFNRISIRYKSLFIESIFKTLIEYNWVDIENHYYSSLVRLYKNLEKENMDKSPRTDKELDELNNCFDFLREKFVEYLQTIDKKIEQPNHDIEGHFFSELKVTSDSTSGDEILFLNFNYTSTLDFYQENRFPDIVFTVNHIHGKLNSETNPIIFGYGDEMDQYFEKIERLNDNRFLKNIKSFGYFMTDNYQNLIKFIDQAFFEVHIMGHSCGLSDRILLNRIFEHRYCDKIKIYYYQKTLKENDFTEKTHEISRHFRPNAKSKMREIIVPFRKCKPLTKLQ